MVYRFAHFRLAPATRDFWRDGRLTHIPRRVFECLAYLIEHRDRAVGRDELVAALWGRVDVADVQVNQLIVRARRAIDDRAEEQRAIRTVPGFGYRWVMDVERYENTIQPACVAAPIETSSEAAGTPASRRSWTPGRWIWAGLGTAAALVMGAALHRLVPVVPASAVDDPIESLVVYPLDVSGPPDAIWIRLGAMDLVAERLRNAGLRVPSSEAVLGLLRTNPTVSEAGDGTGQPAFDGARTVHGSAVWSPNGWRVALQVDAGAFVHHAFADNPDAIVAAQAATDQLLAALGRTGQGQAREEGDLAMPLQRVRAALLSNETDTAQSILDGLSEQAQGDPRVRYQRARVALRAGRLDEAEAILTALLDTQATAEDVRFGGSVRVDRGAIRFRRGQLEAAERDFDAAIAALRDGDAPELGEALNSRGITRVALGKLDLAGADLGLARTKLELTGNRLGVARVDANLGLLEGERGRFDQALFHLNGAVDQFEALGAVSNALLALATVFDAQASLLRWPEALVTSDRRWQLGRHAADPNVVALIAVDRIRAQMALGRYRDAEALLADTHRWYPADARAMRYLHAVDAELAWRQQRWQTARAVVDQAMAVWPADTDEALKAWLLLIRQRSALGAGEPAITRSEQDPAIDEPVSPARLVPVAAYVAVAERAAHAGRIEEAQHAYQQSFARAETTGVPAELVMVAASYVPWLIGQGRLDDAAAMAGRVAPWARDDFDCALLQTRVFRTGNRRDAWTGALQRAQALAGERPIEAELLAFR